MNIRTTIIITCILGVTSNTYTLAAAEWHTTILHPSGATSSRSISVHGTQQVGEFLSPTGLLQACIWNGTSASVVSLHPPQALFSSATGISGSHQAGTVLIAGRLEAVLWNGTAESMISLQPNFAHSSQALAIYNTTQVGLIKMGPTRLDHACLWRGDSTSCIDLHPAMALRSAAYAVDCDQQVGYAEVESNGVGSRRACLWLGTADSLTILHPQGASSSTALGVHGGQQVGYARFFDGDRASLWMGTANSWQSLHPNGFDHSYATGVFHGQQCGAVGTSAPGMELITRAAMWRGTSESWVDLHALLPSTYSMSYATHMFNDDTSTYITGWATIAATGSKVAVMWVGPPPLSLCDSLDFNQDGYVCDTQDLDDFIAVMAGGTSACSTFPIPGCADTDFNNDGLSPDSTDLDAFLSRLAGGPCF